MMFSIIIILNLFVLVELNNENFEDVSTLKKEAWVDVHKRLNRGSKYDQYGCRTLNMNGTIIMAHASLNNGASYIPGPSVSSAHECASACCDTQECNVAVYKLKGSSGLCYLFNCGTDTKLCNFTRLDGYVSMKLNDRSKDFKSQIESNDFESQLPQVTSKIFVNNATSKQPNVDSTTTLLPSEKSLQVPLFGSCDTNSDCSTMASECVVSFCLCRKGYHAQNGRCRRDCTRFEFECVNEGHPLADPQCIAVYDACDGIAHCADESDERSCPAANANRLALDPQNSLQGKAVVVEKNDENKKVLNDQSENNTPEIDQSSADHMIIDSSNDFPEFSKHDHLKSSAPSTGTEHNDLVQNENSVSADTNRHSVKIKQGVRYNENKQMQSPSTESHSRLNVHQGESAIPQSSHSIEHKLSRDQLMENENHKEMDNNYMGGEQNSFHNRQHLGKEKSWPPWEDVRSFNEEEQDNMLQEKHSSPDYVEYYQPGYDIQRTGGVSYRLPSHNRQPSFKDNRNYQSLQQLPSLAVDGQQSAQHATNDIVDKNEAKQQTNKKTDDRSKGEKTTTEASIKPTITTSVKQSSSSTIHESITLHPSSKTELPKPNLLEVAEIEEGAKSAMIILILGLLLTFIMLVLIGCRLRTMKMRLRRGATLSSQEADYLINGMYL